MLNQLNTELGPQSTYDAVSQCSRCGYCEQACPTYVATGREAWSGRGRNQVVRLLLEGRFQEQGSASEALSTCLLCGACTTACPAHVPTADLVLEGRRHIRGSQIHGLMRILEFLIVEHPEWLAWALKAAYLFKRLGLSTIIARTGLLRLLGLQGLERAESHVSEPPDKLLFEFLREDADLQEFDRARWVYFAPCGSNYLYPKVGLASLQALKALLGPGAFLNNACCGLLCYNYGSLESARILAKANIERLETSRTSQDIPLIADCSSCAAHLKSYPQLFAKDSLWADRARRFSKRVRDFIEVIPEQGLRRIQRLKATYHDSCRALNGQGISSQPRHLMRKLDSGYLELPEAEVCCGGAGAFTFMHPELSDQILRRKVANIASIQAHVVAASSTSCLMQLADGLKKYYPECRVVHVSELVTQALHLPPEMSGVDHGQTART